MNAYATTARRLRQTAPVLSLAAALVLPSVFPHEPSSTPADNGVELAMVAAAVESVPYRVGQWVGRDVPIPEAARRLLRPNAMLSRRYVDLQSGRWVDLAIVHCGDSRDMLGHYPPICYPSNGWVKTSQLTGDSRHDAQGDPVELLLSETAIPARLYHYSRAHAQAGWTNESHVRIFNFFVLPDGSFTRDIDDVGRRASWLGARVQGVAQVQVLTDQRLDLDEATESAREILEGIEGLFDALGVRSAEREEKAMGHGDGERASPRSRAFGYSAFPQTLEEL